MSEVRRRAGNSQNLSDEDEPTQARSEWDRSPSRTLKRRKDKRKDCCGPDCALYCFVSFGFLVLVGCFLGVYWVQNMSNRGGREVDIWNRASRQDTSRAYGEISAEAFLTLGSTFEPPLGKDDVVLDIGFGRGDLLLGIAPHVAAVVGIEINEHGNKLACAALGLEESLTCARGNMQFIRGDIRQKPHLLGNASVVWVNSPAMSHALMHDMLTAATLHSPPGQLLLTVRPLPGCHLGWIYKQTLETESDFTSSINVHVYLRVPAVHHVTPFMVGEGELRAHQLQVNRTREQLRSTASDESGFRIAAAEFWNCSGVQTFRLGAELKRRTLSGDDDDITQMLSSEVALNGKLHKTGLCFARELIVEAVNANTSSNDSVKLSEFATHAVQRMLLSHTSLRAKASSNVLNEEVAIELACRFNSVFPALLEFELPSQSWNEVSSFWKGVIETLGANADSERFALRMASEICSHHIASSGYGAYSNSMELQTAQMCHVDRFACTSLQAALFFDSQSTDDLYADIRWLKSYGDIE